MGDAVGVFARPVPRHIAKHLLVRPLDRNELRRRLGCAETTLDYHLDRLGGLGYLIEDRDREPPRYALADPALVAAVFQIFPDAREANDAGPPEGSS